MIKKIPYPIRLLALYILLLLGGIFFISETTFQFSIQRYIVLLSSMTVITLGVFILISIGSKKNEKSQALFMLIGIGSKFLSYLILILIFWIDGKNFSKEFIIAFFVLYLLLTFSLVRVIYNMLKTN